MRLELMIFDILNCISQLRHTRMFGSRRGVTTLVVEGNLHINITFFGNADCGNIGVDQALDVKTNQRTALVHNAVKVNSPRFEQLDNILCTRINRGNYLLIVTEAEVNVSFRLKAFRHKGFDRLHNTDEVVFHIHSASAPDKLTVIFTAERRISPVVKSTL